MSEGDPFLADNALNIWEELRSGAAAVVARTLAVGPDPGGWSNVERSVQKLDLEVEEQLCGTAPRHVTVELPVVQGSSITASEPRLADWLAVPGARAIHLLRQKGPAVDEDLAALRATAENVAAVRDLCASEPPPGLPALAMIAVGSDPLPSTVIDIVDCGKIVARIVSSGRESSAYSGVRATRLARSRPPDLTLTPAELDDALRGVHVACVAPELARCLALAGESSEHEKPGELDRLASGILP